jgi:hypothetical protein
LPIKGRWWYWCRKCQQSRTMTSSIRCQLLSRRPQVAPGSGPDSAQDANEHIMASLGFWPNSRLSATSGGAAGALQVGAAALGSRTAVLMRCIDDDTGVCAA